MMRANDRRVLPSRIGGTPSKPTLGTTAWLIILLFCSILSFYLGIWAALAASGGNNCPERGLDAVSRASANNDRDAICADACLGAAIDGKGELGRKIEKVFENRVRKELQAKCPQNLMMEKLRNSEARSPSSNEPSRRFQKSLSHFANGLVRIGRKDLFDTYDFGVPISSNAEKEDVLLLYDAENALPSNKSLALSAKSNDEIPHANAIEATANCDALNVLFIKNPNKATSQCFALVGGQYQNYHVQRWMRVNGSEIDRDAPLQMVGRMRRMNGFDELLYPLERHLEIHRDLLRTYLNNFSDVMRRLKPIAKSIAIDNTIIVMTCNKGQSELLMNFVCSSRARGFDIKNILLFPTDLETKELAEGMGLKTFYDENLTESIPTKEAERYGDGTFGHIMLAKVLCVHLINELGYDLLFQDVDVVWYKDPLKFFHNNSSSIANFDVYFQDDGNRQERYTPYSANSGFYFIRSNRRTKLLFRTMMYSGDLIFACRSHQQILIALLAEMNSLAGLSVKILSRDSDDFPGGYHYHMRKGFMKNFVTGKISPYVFHMSWTLNKVNKLEFLRQMGEWYLHDKCIGKEAKDIISGTNKADNLAVDLIEPCCSAEPIISCHYRDKPSKIPCKESPPKDKGANSFW